MGSRGPITPPGLPQDQASLAQGRLWVKPPPPNISDLLWKRGLPRCWLLSPASTGQPAPAWPVDPQLQQTDPAPRPQSRLGKSILGSVTSILNQSKYANVATAFSSVLSSSVEIAIII